MTFAPPLENSVPEASDNARRSLPGWQSSDELPGVHAEDLGTSPGAARKVPAPVFGPTDRRRGWIVALIITAIGAITRFANLGSPTDKGTPVFDEKHYVPQAWQVLTGDNWLEDNPAYGLVVHPPVGKWMIAIGEWLFGYDAWGWRFMSAVCGTLMILIVVRLVRRLTRSTLVGAIAGVLMIVDGVTFVASRTGLLDIFQIFFILAALAAIVCDRDQMRARMHKVYSEGRIHDSPYGPRLGFRWWRFAAAIALGLACGTKWSGIYFVIFFTVLSLGFDVAARKAYLVQRPWRGVLLRDVIPTGFSLGVTPVLIYLATFAPWFSSETAVYRYEVGRQIGTGGPFAWVPDAWRSLWYYESGVLSFHSNLTNSAGNHHPWESKPWTWPMGLRPMLYYIEYGPEKCGESECVKAMMFIGTPIMWWLALPMLAWALWRMFIRRDWRYAVVLVGYGAAYLPWFTNLDRQMYFFYATAMAPFLIMGLALCVGDVLAASRRAKNYAYEKRLVGAVAVSIYLGLAVANFMWMWPILTGEPISREMWNMQMWLPSWT